MECNADAASPSEAYALLARWVVVLHGFEGRLMSEPRVFAAAGHRCAATVSSMGGERTYPWASPPSTWEKNGLCVRVDGRRLGRRPCLHQLLVYVGEERNRRPRVSFACGPEVPRVKLTPDRLFWRTPGKLQLLYSLRQNLHELLLEV